MMKLILAGFILLTTIISCNNQDHANENEKIVAESSAAREKILQDSVLKFPDSLIVREQLIQFYRDNEDFDNALYTVANGLKKNNMNSRLWDIKATLHFENGDTLNAISSFETVLQIDPSPRILILLGSLYAQTKNIKALAIADALLQTKLPETEKEAYFIKGFYYNYTGDYNKAISFFDKCLSLDHMHMFAYREKGIALYEMGKYNDAITVLDKAVTLQNSFDEGYYWLGRCLEKLNKPNDAIEEYRTALMYTKDYTQAQEALERLGAK